ncbi:phosphate/phosphite/phosphonate ABC transporter substrate-binding protein [Rhodoferax antarcticus]|uniref:Phosphonate ABC transporter, periplasmic phosphonate-binding protein n=1 Tax=Rhodoferax antarcticus ANT.BR TaxID=1111071 RepID=A0A1Q8YIZ4_9BURK|nr:PhnD/SsuA/transferrin family substrate-binding protein [Rhodoferax antarcticus]APW48078.1 phosphonate ABC transporter substrate-binding protein [Rhodoferax antarcticus]OLP07933.1 phosphonate ABC transporter, periplasmic phosphonate-binding protein [Rhodoferax antarcticus ANT.BR]
MTSLYLLGEWVVLLAFTSLSACQPESTEQPLTYQVAPAPGSVPQYRLAVYPGYNPNLLAVAYQPLVDHLNTEVTGAQLILEASRDYPAFEKKFAEREPAFLLPNPWQTLQAIQRGYQVIAMAGDPQDFRGIFIVRRDSGLRLPTDLKGKRVSYPARTALAACIMAQYFLHTQGLAVHDTQSLYVGTQESSIMNVYLGDTAARATRPPAWRQFQKDHSKVAAELKVIWQTEPLINNSFMVRDDVPALVRAQVQTSLLGLAQTFAVQAILANMATAAFYPASNASYDVAARNIERFEREVRPVEKP